MSAEKQLQELAETKTRYRSFVEAASLNDLHQTEKTKNTVVIVHLRATLRKSEIRKINLRKKI